ncbi:MAG: sodium:proton antiporter NhaD, partial [Prevotellaceae bacterium]|nr:sodium:proton antiporter NhaD [Candidatus Colivivens equi]
MFLIELTIAAVLLASYLLMSTDRLNHINRAALAMFTGVAVWVVLLLGGDNIHNTQWNHYIQKALEVILFLIATNTIIKIMNNNGVFDSLKTLLRTRNSRALLWYLSLLTFVISANVENLTTVVLMMMIMTRIVRSHSQRIVYSCVILVAANLGGSVSVIGGMTSLMMWAHNVITPTDFFAGLIIPALTSLVVFNLLIGKFMIGRVEVSSTLGIGDDDVYLPGWQKILLLIIGLASIWFVPSFSRLTNLPPFIGALTAMALVLMLDGIYNFKRNGNQLFVNRKFISSNEYV